MIKKNYKKGLPGMSIQSQNQIPRIIHYCWFGKKEKPNDVRLCIESWRTKLPDYQIIEWNEENFLIVEAVQYVKEAYEKKKWAFVSDYVRLKVLYEYGGIYLDTDVEVFKRFDDLLDNNFFAGFESKDYVATAVLACKKNNDLIKLFLDSYADRKFIRQDGSLDIETTNVVELTLLLKKQGLLLNGKQQLIKGGTIYPQKYFASNDFLNIFGRYRKDIYSYHHCAASWYDIKREKTKRNLIKHYLVGIARNSIGTNTLIKIKKSIKKREKYG